MKKRKGFNCKRKRQIILNCPEKARISIIINTSDINNIENIKQGKE